MDLDTGMGIGMGTGADTDAERERGLDMGRGGRRRVIERRGASLTVCASTLRTGSDAEGGSAEVRHRGIAVEVALQALDVSLAQALLFAADAHHSSRLVHTSTPITPAHPRHPRVQHFHPAPPLSSLPSPSTAATATAAPAPPPAFGRCSEKARRYAQMTYAPSLYCYSLP
ncbi:hypothetical protein B484DRAFT_65586 [Ochromonadaceae sp. CCMP2298]|nr:hypothetical protein B484DRAFT_65586 [Ochromonadaceae sp. CCMP2298]